MAALEHSGTPSLYFPVINPQAKGDQVIAPTPERLNQEKTFISNDVHDQDQSVPTQRTVHNTFMKKIKYY